MKLFVSNYPFSVTDEELREMLVGACGEIESLKLCTDRDTGKSRGFAFVTFTTPAARERCLEFNEAWWKGRELRVKVAVDRPVREDASDRRRETAGRRY